MKPLLVLDLDETLVCCVGPKRDQQYPFEGTNRLVTVDNVNYHVKLRNGAEKFLKFVQPRFDVWIYSNGHEEYLKQVVQGFDEIGIHINPKKVLAREPKNLNKKLARVMDSRNQQLETALILDDNFESWKSDLSSYDKLLMSKRYVAWTDFSGTQEKIANRFPLGAGLNLEPMTYRIIVVGRIRV